MNTSPEAFALAHADTAKPLLLDEDHITENWPMPAVKVWAPVERVPLFARVREFVRDVLEPGVDL